MKNSIENSITILPTVTYDPALDVHAGVVLFPKKLALANEILAKFYAPNLEKKAKKKKNTSKIALSALQKELLNFYEQEPTDAQMNQLKDFMTQLFAKNPSQPVAVKQELEIAA